MTTTTSVNPMQVIYDNIGSTLRLTWPDGTPQTGAVEILDLPRGGDYVAYNKARIGGEFCNVTSIERLNSTGAFTSLWRA